MSIDGFPEPVILEIHQNRKFEKIHKKMLIYGTSTG